jgi:hypothetical protein
VAVLRKLPNVPLLRWNVPFLTTVQAWVSTGGVTCHMACRSIESPLGASIILTYYRETSVRWEVLSAAAIEGSRRPNRVLGDLRHSHEHGLEHHFSAQSFGRPHHRGFKPIHQIANFC